MDIGSLKGICVFKTGKTSKGKWKAERYELVCGEGESISYYIVRMGYYDDSDDAEKRVSRFIHRHRLKNTGVTKTFGLDKLELYSY